jgi:hypothetical protein
MVQWMQPWHMPAAMCFMNATRLVTVLATEGRIHPNALKFTVLYWMTIRPAMRGDVQPFLQILALPG